MAQSSQPSHEPGDASDNNTLIHLHAAAHSRAAPQALLAQARQMQGSQTANQAKRGKYLCCVCMHHHPTAAANWQNSWV
jgi:hypothetical protein